MRSSSEVSDESSFRVDEFDDDKVDSCESWGGDCFRGNCFEDSFIVSIGGRDGVGVTKADRRGEEGTFVWRVVARGEAGVEELDVWKIEVLVGETGERGWCDGLVGGGIVY